MVEEEHLTGEGAHCKSPRADRLALLRGSDFQHSAQGLRQRRAARPGAARVRCARLARRAAQRDHVCAAAGRGRRRGLAADRAHGAPRTASCAAAVVADVGLVDQYPKPTSETLSA